MSIKVVGCDVASSTGLCFMPVGSPPWTWRCLAIESEGAHGLDRARDFVGAFRDYIVEEKPDFAVIEEPIGIVPHGKINAKTVTKLWALAGATVAVLETVGVPWGLISIHTWRASYYGKGVKPVDGDWKALAMKQAERQRIVLPDNKKAARDCAEAAGVAASWTQCSFIPAVHHHGFMNARMGRPLRQEVPA